MYYRWFLQNALTDLFAVATLYPAWPTLSRFWCRSLKTQYAFMYIDVWARPIIKRLHIPDTLHVTLNTSCTVYSTCTTPLIDGRIFRCQSVGVLREIGSRCQEEISSKVSLIGSIPNIVFHSSDEGYVWRPRLLFEYSISNVIQRICSLHG